MSETDIVLCMLFIMVVAADTKKASVWHVLSVETTDYLKGIFATMILFHHITQVTGGSIFLNMGYLGVSGFLFCSGYGLFCSYNAQKDYVYKIIYRKIPEILLISFITIVYSAMYFNFLGGGVLLSEFAKILAGNRLLNWYFTEIIVLYILFAVSIKAARDSHKVLAIYNFILTTGMAGILCIMYLFGGVGLHWFISLYAFPFGVLFGVTGDKILKLVSSKKRTFLVGILFLIVFLCINYAKIWRYHILLKLTRILILCLSSVIFCVVICGIFRMYQSRGILSWIGKRSAEMILTQQIALHVFRNNIIYVKNDIMWVLGSLVMQIGLMMVVRPLYNQVRLKFK